MCVGAVTGMVTSCATSICASMTCCACSKAMGKLSTATRMVYAILLFIAILASAAMLTDSVSAAIKDALSERWWGGFLEGQILPTVPKETVGALAVYRVMMGVVIFHAILACCLCGVRSTSDVRSKLQNDLWCVKIPLLIGLIVAMFFLPGELVLGVGPWFKVGGFLFVFLQLMFLCAFSFDIYDDLLSWGEAEEAGDTGCCEAGCFGNRIIWWNWLTVLLCLGSYGFCIFTFVAIVIVNNNHEEGCWIGVMAGLINMIMMVVVTGFSISNFVRDAPNGAGHRNGVFQSGIVSAYACYLVFSAMVNSPDPTPGDWEMNCHVMGIAHGSGWMKIVGLFFVFTSVLWSAIRSGGNAFFASPMDTADAEAPLLAAPVNENGEATGEKADDETEDEGGVTYSYTQFHIMFALAACYCAMLLTRWGEVVTTDRDGSTELDLHDSTLSVWLKVVSSLLCYLIYIWAMVAPPLCPDRDFS